MDPSVVRTANKWRCGMAVFLIMCGDLVALVLALAAALMLRFDSANPAAVFRSFALSDRFSLPLALLAYPAIFWAFRLYKYAWRFAGLETLRGVILGNTTALLLMVAIQYLIDGHTLPRSVLAIFLMTSIATVGFVRIILRLASLGTNYGERAIDILRRDLRPKRVVILGSGPRSVRLLNGLREEMSDPYNVIGLLDDRPARHGLYIHDVQVLGPLNYLYELLDDRAVDEVLIAMPDVPGSEIREYVMACRKRKIPVRVLPGLRDMLNGARQTQLEEISVEDLLRRPVAKVDMDEMALYLTGKRILVTGAGGSIGSELCRQIVKLNPATLVLLGHGENSIHELYNELLHKDPGLTDVLRMTIASTADGARINSVIEEHRPHIVFHAAAHKHVPIMEINVLEAVHNNIIGTYNVAEACGKNGVAHMVLISTDKAVYPSSVMGATKRICEEILQMMVPEYPRTDYITVRFGNVLGSRGSAVPIFHDQIKRGGPVTVTHSEMTRFFMSIPEAVALVLQAGAIGTSGELYVLDMGTPVRIVDLAEDMIRLCGYEPDVEIPIVFTGMRPGEKLHEELIEDGESLMPARRKGLWAVRRQPASREEIRVALTQMRETVQRGDAKEARDLLHEMIPNGASRMLVGKP